MGRRVKISLKSIVRNLLDRLFFFLERFLQDFNIAWIGNSTQLGQNMCKTLKKYCNSHVGYS